MAYDIKETNGELVLGENVMKALNTLKEFQITKQEMANEEEEIKGALLAAMADAGIKSFENDLVKITYTPEHIRETADTAEMKKQGIWEAFKKESTVKASVRVTYRD